MRVAVANSKCMALPARRIRKDGGVLLCIVRSVHETGSPGQVPGVALRRPRSPDDGLSAVIAAGGTRRNRLSAFE